MWVALSRWTQLFSGDPLNSLEFNVGAVGQCYMSMLLVQRPIPQKIFIMFASPRLHSITSERLNLWAFSQKFKAQSEFVTAHRLLLDRQSHKTSSRDLSPNVKTAFEIFIRLKKKKDLEWAFSLWYQQWGWLTHKHMRLLDTSIWGLQIFTNT